MNRHKLLHTDFELWATRRPTKCALEFEDQRFTYGAVNTRADQLARELGRTGVGPESLVAVMLDRSPDLIVAILATLKAGGVYVPVDPSYPAERVSYIVADARPAAVITDSRYERVFTAAGIKSIICVDQLAVSVDGGPGVGTHRAVAARHLAYVIYTSGSSGAPKGVMIEHRAIVNTVLELQKRYYIDETSRVLQFSSISFDASVVEIFSTLGAGGTLVLPGAAVFGNFHRLAGFLRERAISVATLPPAILEHLDVPSQSSLQTLVSAGEVCPLELARRFVGTVRHFVNAYGPAECAVCVTTHEVLEVVGEHVAIGTPLSNVRTYVFDEQLREVGENVIGTLYVGGSGLARGYVDPLAAEGTKFIRHPRNARQRIYATGDRVYRGKDGNLYCVGRTDSLLKLHGIRIDASEVEAAVRSLAGIIACAVVLRETPRGARRLACYYSASAPIPEHRFREHLRARLPRQFIPHHFVFLRRLPLNPSGKVDRDALSRLDTEIGQPGPAASTGDERARDYPQDVESLVRQVWADVLEVHSLDPDTGFYEHGGDSLGAMRVAAELSAIFGVELDGTDVTDSPTFLAFLKRLRERILVAQPRPPVRTTDWQVAHPLTSMQEMFWFLHQLEPDAPMNNATKVVELRGEVDAEQWRTCIREVTSRHAVLRSQFYATGEGPRQTVRQDGDVQMDYYDFSQEPPATRARQLRDALDESSWRNFALERDLLIRATLLKLSPSRFLFALTTHHIICDGSSIDILMAELLAAYLARIHGQPPDLSSLPVEYADFVAREQRRNGDFGATTDREFWLSHLSAYAPSVELPYDRQPTGQRTYSGQAISGCLEAALKYRLARLAEHTGATLNEVLFSAFALFLQRLCRQEDVTIGVPVSLRDRKEWDGVVGVFLNVLPIRRVLVGIPTVREYIRETHTTFQACLKHKHMGFNRIVDLLKPRREPGANPLFNVMFDFAVASDLPVDEALEASAVPTPTGMSKFDLTLSVLASPTRIELCLEYSTELFKATTARRLLDNFQVLVVSMSDELDMPISDLPLMGDRERAQVLGFGQGERKALPKTSVVALFEQQCARTPTIPAVKCGDETITYRELSVHASTLAVRLRSLGVGRGSVVGVVMDRSITTVASIIGIWKAGGAYLPVQPEFPAARIATMLEDAGASVVMTDASTDSDPEWAIGFPGQIMRVDEVLRDGRRDVDIAGARAEIRGEDLAYIIFTSGSTGRPKGVMIEHRGMLNHLETMITELHLRPGSVVAQNAPFCFDISVWQLVTALLVGGEVVVYSRETVLDAPRFFRLLKDDRVSHLEVVPSFLSTLLEVTQTSDSKMGLSHLQWLLVTGETAPAALVRKWLRRFPTVPVVNAYGPAEASDDVTFHVMCRPGPRDRTPVPVGKPLQNVTVYVLDDTLRPCPIGGRGEICISGIAVGPGYIRPEDGQTAFGSDPLATTPGTRLYRSGDIGRWNDRGELEFLGRADQQVKVNGHRIELGEIESHLRPMVDDVAVVVRESAGGTYSLVTYYATRRDVTPAELRATLLRAVPHYMVPSHFVRLPRLPRNMNGKLDRRNLPDPVAGTGEGSIDRDVLSPLMQQLAAIWQQVLKVSAVTPDDNFFDLGGDSLTAVKIVGQLAQKGYSVAVKDLYRYQSIQEFVDNVPFAHQPAARKVRRKRVLPLTPMQAEFFIHRYTRPNFYTQAIVVDVRSVDVDRLHTAFTHIQRYHEALRVRFVRDADGRPQQVLGPLRENILRVFDQDRSVPSGEREAAMQEMLRESLDLVSGPLFVAGLCREGNSFRLMLVAHHTIVDVLSWGILLEDIEKVYLQLASGRPTKLARRLTTLTEWSLAVDARANGAEPTSQIPYWLDVVGTQKHLFQGEIGDMGGVPERGLVTYSLNSDLTAVFRALTRDHRRFSAEALLLFPLAQALDRNGTLVVWIERHGRDAPEWQIDLSRTVGWCASLFPFALKAPPHLAIGQQVQALSHDLGSVPNRGADFSLLKYLRDSPDVELIRSAVDGDLVFNYLGEVGFSEGVGMFTNFRLLKDSLVAPENLVPHRVELDCYIAAGQLICEWRFSPHAVNMASVKAMAHKYIQSLDRLIGVLQSAEVHRNFTDFTLTSVDNDRLAAIRARLKDSTHE